MTRLFKISSTAVIFGLLAISLMFAYYHFHWGIKPCQGLPTDASNCGDADMGGVYFLAFGAPSLFLGTMGLITSAVMAIFNRHQDL